MSMISTVTSSMVSSSTSSMAATTTTTTVTGIPVDPAFGALAVAVMLVALLAVKEFTRRDYAPGSFLLSLNGQLNGPLIASSYVFAFAVASKLLAILH